MCTYRLDIEFPSLIKNKLGVLEGSGGDFGRGEGKKTRGLRDGGRTVACQFLQADKLETSLNTVNSSVQKSKTKKV